MNELIEFLTSKEIIVVYIVAAIACILCFIIYVVDKNYYKRKQRHNTKELNKLVEDINEIIENEQEEKHTETYNTPVLETLISSVSESHSSVANPISKKIIESTVEIVENNKEEEKPIIKSETTEAIESPEIEELEPLHKVEDIVLDTMVEETKEESVEEISYTTIEPNRQQAQEELMRLTEELEKAEQAQKTIDLTAYEEEQEENAIISLEELVRKSKEMYESNEYTQYADEGNEPISLEDLERRMNKVQEEITAIESKKEDTPVIVSNNTLIEEPVMIDKNIQISPQQQLVLDDFNSIETPKIDTSPIVVDEKPTEPSKTAYQTVKKFERSPVISPIYGIERKETKEEIELENTANYDKLDEEIKKTNEFLMTLRELQRNLD